jgi:hypothetical protein
MTIDYDRDQLSYALANALKERDEAREEAAQWHNKAQQTTDVRLRDALIEREDMWKTLIDIKKQNAKLRDIAEEMLYYVQYTATQEKFRAELDQLKEGGK